MHLVTFVRIDLFCFVVKTVPLIEIDVVEYTNCSTKHKCTENRFDQTF